MQASGVVQTVVNRGSNTSLNINGEWFGCWNYTPDCSEGDTISFEYEEKPKGDRVFKNIKTGTVSVVGAATATTAVPKPASTGHSYAARDVSIQYQSSRKDALQVLPILLEAGAVSLPTKKDAKYDAALAILEELTNRFYVDIQNCVANGDPQAEDIVPNPDNF